MTRAASLPIRDLLGRCHRDETRRDDRLTPPSFPSPPHRLYRYPSPHLQHRRPPLPQPLEMLHDAEKGSHSSKDDGHYVVTESPAHSAPAPVVYDPSKESIWTRLGVNAESFKRAPGTTGYVSFPFAFPVPPPILSLSNHADRSRTTAVKLLTETMSTLFELTTIPCFSRR